MDKKINVKLILELRSAGMGRNAIAASRHISKNSVGDVFHIADRMGISYGDIAQMDEDTVYRKFYPDKFVLENLYDKPDYEYVHQELKRTGVTLKLLWQEYQDKCRASGNIPMGYTKYCQGYSEYTIVNKLTNHLEHKPGVAVEVDWSGSTMTYVDVKPSCLIIDEVGRCVFDKANTRLFFDMIDRRYNKDGPCTMIFTSNKSPAQWREFFSEDDTLLCSLDRIFDDATVFMMKGDSYRGKKLETLGIEAGIAKHTEYKNT